jgi:hypothetical protein
VERERRGRARRGTHAHGKPTPAASPTNNTCEQGHGECHEQRPRHCCRSRCMSATVSPHAHSPATASPSCRLFLPNNLGRESNERCCRQWQCHCRAHHPCAHNCETARPTSCILVTHDNSVNRRACAPTTPSPLSRPTRVLRMPVCKTSSVTCTAGSKAGTMVSVVSMTQGELNIGKHNRVYLAQKVCIFI